MHPMDLLGLGYSISTGTTGSIVQYQYWYYWSIVQYQYWYYWSTLQYQYWYYWV